MIGIEKPKIETSELSPDGTYGKIVVEPLSPGLPREELVVSPSALIHILNMAFQFLIRKMFVLRCPVPAAFHLVLHIRVDKKPKRVLLPQDIIRASSDDYTV